MERLRDLWDDIKFYIEDHPYVRWLGLIVVGIVVAIGLFIGLSQPTDEVVEVGEEPTEEVSQVDESSDVDVLEKQKVRDETAYILTHPEEYDSVKVNEAYHDSLTTFDSSFVEDNVYLDPELLDGVYVYHEKANEEYTEVLQKSYDISQLGVPVYFYTPQLDQSIASLSNHVPVIEGGKVVVYAVVVRDGQVEEEFKSIEGVVKYMEGVIDANTKE